MKYYTVVLLLIYSILINGQLINHNQLISDFLSAKRCTQATLLSCNELKTDVMKLIKNLSDYQVNYFECVNTTNASISVRRGSYHLGIILNADCSYANDILQKSGQLRYFGPLHHWLLITTNTEFNETFNNVSMFINSDINVAYINDDNVTIFELYNPSSQHGGKINVSVYGYYNSSGYMPQFRNNKYERRKNMTGVRFKSAVMIPVQVNQTVEEYLGSDENREYNSMHRFQSTTIKHCQDMYNFSFSNYDKASCHDYNTIDFRLDIQATPSWGYIVPGTGGKFDGLVGLLQRKEVDFGCTPLIFKYDRLPVIDYSFGNWILKSVFIYQPPKGSVSSFEIFVKPLEPDVWLSTFLASLITCIVMKCACVAEWFLREDKRDEVDTRWSHIILTIFGAFCLQGSSYNPSLLSGRILMIIFFMFFVMLYQFYAGCIVSDLLMDPPRLINNLHDLLHSTLEAGIEEILIDHDYFVQTRDPVAIELYRTKIANKKNHTGFYVPEIGMDLVKQGGFAFHIETSTAYPIIKKTFPPKTICVLEEVQMYRTQPMHTNAQKHSPFREMLNFCMLRIVEHGLMYRLRKHWDAHRPECIEADHTLDITVGLSEFYCALVVLFVGMLISCIFLMHEFYTFRKESKKKKENEGKPQQKASKPKSKKKRWKRAIFDAKLMKR